MPSRPWRCRFGLTAIRFAIMGDNQQLVPVNRPSTWFWELAVGAIVFAGVLDGMDGRIARLLRAESRFGAELDSLSDAIAFGVSPAILLYLWSLQEMPRFGWIACLALALSCVLRLARFNANLDVIDQPRKLAGFNTGVPAPAGAGIALMPVLCLVRDRESHFPRLASGRALAHLHGVPADLEPADFGLEADARSA